MPKTRGIRMAVEDKQGQLFGPGDKVLYNNRKWVVEVVQDANKSVLIGWGDMSQPWDAVAFWVPANQVKVVHD